MNRSFGTFVKSFHLYKPLYQVPSQFDACFKSYGVEHFGPTIAKRPRTPGIIGLNVIFQHEVELCNSCHDLMMETPSFSEVANVSINYVNMSRS